MPDDPQPTGARAALKAAITEQITAQTGDAEGAAERAHALVEEKRRRTRTGIYLFLVTVAIAGLAYQLKVNPLITIAIAAAGALWAGLSVSPEYFKAAAADLVQIVTTLKRAKDGAP